MPEDLPTPKKSLKQLEKENNAYYPTMDYLGFNNYMLYLSPF